MCLLSYILCSKIEQLIRNLNKSFTVAPAITPERFKVHASSCFHVLEDAGLVGDLQPLMLAFEGGKGSRHQLFNQIYPKEKGFKPKARQHFMSQTMGLPQSRQQVNLG